MAHWDRVGYDEASQYGWDLWSDSSGWDDWLDSDGRNDHVINANPTRQGEDAEQDGGGGDGEQDGGHGAEEEADATGGAGEDAQQQSADGEQVAAEGSASGATEIAEAAARLSNAVAVARMRLRELELLQEQHSGVTPNTAAAAAAGPSTAPPGQWNQQPQPMGSTQQYAQQQQYQGLAAAAAGPLQAPQMIEWCYSRAGVQHGDIIRECSCVQCCFKRNVQRRPRARIVMSRYDEPKTDGSIDESRSIKVIQCHYCRRARWYVSTHMSARAWWNPTYFRKTCNRPFHWYCCFCWPQEPQCLPVNGVTPIVVW